MFKFASAANPTVKEQILNRIKQEVPKLEKKIANDKKLLRLMYALIKFSEKQEKTPEEINIFNEMFAMYSDEKIESGQKNTSQSDLKETMVFRQVVPVPPPMPSEPQEKSLSFKELKAYTFKNVKQNIETDLLPTMMEELNKTLENTHKNLRPVIKKPITSSDENKSNLTKELEKKFALIAHKEEENNKVLSQTNNEFSEKWEKLLDVLCNDYLTPEEINSEYFFEIQEKIFSGDFNKEESQEFSVYARNKMAAKEFIERPNRALSLIQDFSESRPTSIMFDKTLQPIQTDLSALEQNKPVIVGGIPKLKV